MTRRRRVDVDLDELDQIIDRSQRAPLSEAEGEKLKTALHAMAERLLQKRSTEKTSAVLPPDPAPAGEPESNESALPGHGRNPSAVFRGANQVTSRTLRSIPATYARSAAAGKSTTRKNRQDSYDS